MKISNKRAPLITINALLLMLTFGIGGLTAMAVDDDTPAAEANPAQKSLDDIVPDKQTGESASNRVHTVRLGREGLVPGRIAIRGADGNPRVVNNVKVHFVKNGQPVAIVTPGVNGVFQAKGITAGEYAVVAAGPEVVAAYTVHVVADDGVATQRLDATLQLQSQGIPAQDFPVVNSMVNSLVTSDFCSRYCNAPLSGPMVPTAETGTIIDHRVVPSSGTQLPIDSAPLVPIPDTSSDEAAIKADTTYKNVSFVDEATDSKPVSPFHTQSVHLQADGKISGRIHWTKATAPYQEPAADAKVAFIRNGQVHQIAQTDKDGRYEVTGLSEGSYSVFTACQSAQCSSPMGIQSGCSAFSVDCLPPVESTVVSENACCIDSCLVGCPNMDYTLETMCGSMCGGTIVESAPIVETEMAYAGGYAGGCCGGGGGGGLFGGGLGAILGGIGIGLWAAHDDDDGKKKKRASPYKPY